MYYKFTRNDKFVNTLKLFPELKFTVYNGSASYNDTPHFSGSFTGSIITPSPGMLSLYELNVDRRDCRDVAGCPPPIGAQGPFNNNFGLCYQWIVKDGQRLNVRTSTSEAFVDANPGDIIYGPSGPLTASISKEYYSTTTARSSSAQICDAAAGSTCGAYLEINSVGSVSHLLALKNTINYYRYLSPHFEYSSSINSLDPGIHDRDFNTDQLGLVSIPSIFYGSNIKKGTVKLDIYYTGSLVATVEDTKRNGELIQTYSPYTPTYTGSVVGLVLYNEGFLILTSSVALNGETEDYGTDDNYPNWINFAQSLPSPGTTTYPAPSSTFVMTMSGTSNTQIMTLFATAPKGELNHSNNPSYIQNTLNRLVSTGPRAYIESDQIPIKNIVSSSYNTPTGSFEKLTYISKVGLYDKDKNLIGIAKTATPLKKTINKDFTFKLKLDI